MIVELGLVTEKTCGAKISLTEGEGVVPGQFRS